MKFLKDYPNKAKNDLYMYAVKSDEFKPLCNELLGAILLQITCLLSTHNQIVIEADQSYTEYLISIWSF